MADDVEIRARPWDSRPRDALLAAWRAAFRHGGAVAGAFVALGAANDVTASLARDDFVTWFLTSDAVATSLPEVTAADCDPSGVDFFPAPAAELSAQFAQALLAGGYRGSFSGTAADAHAMAEDFAAELIGPDATECRVLKSFGGWSEWFGSVVWDKTWIVVRVLDKTIFLVCTTDHDGPRRPAAGARLFEA